MALLPLLFLVTIAVATWAFRGQPARFRWTLFGGAAVITWGAVIGLVAATPTSTALSVWQPAQLFHAKLEFVLDDPGWIMAFALATNLVVGFAFMASSTNAPVEAPAPFVLGLSAVGMAGVLAGNLASLILSWAVFDLVLLVRSLSSDRAADRSGSGGFAIFSGLLGLMLVLSATATLENPAASELGGTTPIPPVGLTLLVAAAFLRIGGGRFYSRQQDEPRGTYLEDPFPRIVSASLGASLLIRALAEGIPPDIVRPAQWAFGAIGLIASVSWIIHWRESSSVRYFLLGLLAYSALSATFLATDGQRSAMAGAALAICAAPLVISRRIHVRAHRVASAAMAVLVAGLPGTLGGTLLASLVSSLAGPLDALLAVSVLLGLGCLAGGLLRQARQPSKEWPAGDTLSKGLLTMGKFAPLVAILGASLRLGSTPTAYGGGAFFLAAALALLGSGGANRAPSGAPSRYRRLLAWLDPSGALSLARGATIGALRGVQALASVLEGEGAMLWVLVVLMVILLGSR